MKQTILIIIVAMMLAACGQSAVEPPEPVQVVEPKVTPPNPEIEPPHFAPAEGMEIKQERIITMDIRQTGIEPSTIEADTGDKVVLQLRAIDNNHDFQFRAYGISEKVNIGMPVEVEFIAGVPGTYDYECILNCANAKGTLTVR